MLALQIFFELGMSSVLIQVTSHEAAHLDLVNQSHIEASSQTSRRLSSLFHYLVKWYAAAGGLFLICVFTIGVIFFQRGSRELALGQWIGGWALSSMTTAAFMIFQALVSFLEGIGRISQAAKLRAVQGVVSVVTLFAAIQSGAGLYSPGIALVVGLLVGCGVLANGNWKVLASIWGEPKPDVEVNWTKEMWGFQWRIALSWMSGYLIYQFSTPVVFKLLGSVEAGRYGITQQVVNGISALSMAWTTTRQARWGKWIATGDRNQLNKDFRLTLIRTTGVNLLLALIFISGLVFVKAEFPQYAVRFAEMPVVAGLFFAGMLNQVIFTEAVYLRAHRTEPLLAPSIAGAVVIGGGNLIAAKSSIFHVAMLYLATTIVIGLLWGTIIFIREKRRRDLESKNWSVANG